MARYVNLIAYSTGKVSAVCQYCERKSRPVAPARPPRKDGRPSVMDLAAGWSEAPYPADTVHEDGSTGSLWTCPSCTKILRGGGELVTRDGRSRARNLA